MPPATQTRRPDLDQLDDSELLKRYVEHHDEHAFAELFNRWNGRLVNFVHGKIGDRDTAEELTQETWTQVFRHAHRFDWEKKFSTWIYTIAVNLTKNELRNYSRSRVTLYQRIRDKWSVEEGEDRVLQWSDFSFAPDKEYQRRQLQEAVEEAVGELQPQHRAVFLLREFEGKTYEEIAEVTGAALGTIKSRLSRARGHFSDAIRGRLAKADLDQLEVPDVEPPSDEPVDLNLAGMEELCTLPDVGLTLAEKIIDARPFEDLESLADLKWFSDGRVDKLRPLVTLSEAEERVAESADAPALGAYPRVGAFRYVEAESPVTAGF